MPKDTQLGISKPRDNSLQAYKDWINEVVTFLGGVHETLSEEEWKQNWKEYWL